MNRLQLVTQLSRCIQVSACRKMTASFSTSSRACNDWGKMASTQELQSTLQKDTVGGVEEKEEAMKRIQELKKAISESETKLTGLQKMKYQQEEQEDLAAKQMRLFRSEQRDVNLKIGSVKVDTTSEIRNHRHFRSLSSITNLITSAALCAILYGIFKSVSTKQEKIQAELAAANAADASKKEQSKDIIEQIALA